MKVMSVNVNEQPGQQFMGKFKSPHHAPKAWTHLSGYKLSLDQINELVEKAEISNKPFAEAFGLAREEFKKTHEVIDNQWRVK